MHNRPRRLTRVLPPCANAERKEILEGMLGSNLVCFQTYSYSRHFASTCIRVCGYESTPGGIDANGQVTAITYCPIGIDVSRVTSDR